MKALRRVRFGAIPCLLGIILTVGVVAPRTAATGLELDDITATRAAEHTEVADLRATVSALETEIAILLAPTATPTPEPTATPVPPKQAGETVPLGDQWDVQVVSLTMAPTWEEYVADGQFARVQLLITNLGETRERFPYDDLILRDATDRVYVPDREVLFDIGAGWIVRFDPNIPTDGFITFDIATDSAGPFILESTVDPNFRVLVQVEERG